MEEEVTPEVVLSFENVKHISYNDKATIYMVDDTIIEKEITEIPVIFNNKF